MAEVKNNVHLKILHCSDIHLDTPFAGLPEEKSDERRRALRETFMHITEYIREREVDVVLFSGDLFDCRYATNTTAEILIREFRNCPKTTFIIAPGASDAFADNPIYTSNRLPDNCRVFRESKLSRFDFDEFNLTVYGWAFETPEMTENPLFERRVDDASRINIVCGYADLDGDVDSRSCPVSVKDLSTFAADYYALGSRHESSGFKKAGDSIYSYCGSVECIGFDNPGIGATNLITFDYTDGELATDVKRITFGHLKFVKESIDITGVDRSNEIVNRISRLISDRKYGSETALRVELVGDVAPDFAIPHASESDAFGLYYFDMVDKTMPLYGTAHFLRDMNASGEAYRTLLPMMQSEDETERLIAARAFRVALAALEGRDTNL